MKSVILIRAGMLAVVIAALTGGVGHRASVPSRSDGALRSGETVTALDPISSTSNFYTIRRDLRRCASPRCGGYFIKRVNLPATRCADGRSQSECYVTEIDWNRLPQVEPARALLRGDIVLKRMNRVDSLGVLSVTEAWQTAGDKKPAGSFYRVKDRGLRCITFPCPTHHEAKLNSTLSSEIAGIDLNGAGAPESKVSEASMAMTGADGVLVAGFHARVTGPGGQAETLKATQFYLREAAAQAGKPCIRGGCSNQACADHPVITTCEWRPEYACYQKAKCERQRDGNCGFTPSPELTACLVRARR